MYTHKVMQPRVNEAFMNQHEPIRKLAELPPFTEWMSLSTLQRRNIPIDECNWPVYQRRGLCRNGIGYVLPGNKPIISNPTCNGSAKLIINNPQQFGFEVRERTQLIIEINPSFGVYGYRQGVIVRLGREFSFIDLNNVNFEFIQKCLCFCQIEPVMAWSSLLG